MTSGQETNSSQATMASGKHTVDRSSGAVLTFEDIDSNGSTTASQVFAIVELLEGILLCVDIKTILLAQRVSKNWKATIARSLKLQQALFFDRINDNGLELKCTLPHRKGPPKASEWSACDVEPKMLRNECHKMCLMNPFIFNILREERTEGERYNKFLFCKDDVDRLQRMDSGCWKRMLLTHPSTPSVGVQYNFGCCTNGVEVRNQNGVTLGDVMARLPGLLNHTSNGCGSRLGKSMWLQFSVWRATK